jgi:hypothetical protein
MSTPNALDEIHQVEETLHGILRRELDSRSTELRDAGLRVELDPICRSGERSNYISYIEATLRYADDDVHDIIFFYVADQGRLVVDVTVATKWITDTINESLSKASGNEPA